MRTKCGSGGKAARKLSFELKYCERCGGLWLRPAGGAQIYCVGCAGAVAQMPPVSRIPEAESEEEEAIWKVRKSAGGVA